MGLEQKVEDLKQHLHDRFARRLPQTSPVRIPFLKRDGLIKLFGEFGFKKGAEVGVAQGRFSEYMCQTIPGLDLISTDCWAEYDDNVRSKIIGQKTANARYKEACEKLLPYNVDVIKGMSKDVVQSIKDRSLDYVYLDAGHDFDNVMTDLILWSKKVRKGGIVSGHDYYHFRWAGVVEAVNAYTYAHAIYEWYITADKESTYFWVNP